MTEEIIYDKYKKRGAGYHWQQISRNPLHMSAFVKGRYKKCIDLFAAHAGPLPGLELLDFGCGDGAFSYEMSRHGAKVSGIDLSEEAIEYSNHRHGTLKTGGRFFVESCYETHFPDSSFDGVLSTDVIEHVQDHRKFLIEMHRVLRPGGYAVISTPIRLTESPLDKLHVVEWFPRDFHAMVSEVFSDTTLYYSHPVFWAEASQRSRLLKTLINFMSFYSNPFLEYKKWSLFSLQYAVCKKR